MQIVVTTLAGGSSDVLEAHVSFHLAAGASAVLVGGGARRVDLGTWEDDRRVRLVDAATHTELARLAIAELAADWVVPARPEEFWWPRGESLGDMLAVMPARYGLVQGLVRTFAGARSGKDFAERLTMRTSLLGPRGRGNATMHELLRPAYRAEPDIVIDESDPTLRGRRVPLRAWYPVEVLRFPAEPEIPAGRVDALLSEGALVSDTRLRDVLRALASSPASIVFPVPNVVDDASYAVECAAVGEVDLPGLDRQIRDLELRIAALEARFWPTVRRRVRRLARRPG